MTPAFYIIYPSPAISSLLRRNQDNRVTGRYAIQVGSAADFTVLINAACDDYFPA